MTTEESRLPESVCPDKGAFTLGHVPNAGQKCNRPLPLQPGPCLSGAAAAHWPVIAGLRLDSRAFTNSLTASHVFYFESRGILLGVGEVLEACGR